MATVINAYSFTPTYQGPLDERMCGQDATSRPDPLECYEGLLRYEKINKSFVVADDTLTFKPFSSAHLDDITVHQDYKLQIQKVSANSVNQPELVVSDANDANDTPIASVNLQALADLYSPTLIMTNQTGTNINTSNPSYTFYGVPMKPLSAIQSNRDLLNTFEQTLNTLNYNYEQILINGVPADLNNIIANINQQISQLQTFTGGYLVIDPTSSSNMYFGHPDIGPSSSLRNVVVMTNHLASQTDAMASDTHVKFQGLSTFIGAQDFYYSGSGGYGSSGWPDIAWEPMVNVRAARTSSADVGLPNNNPPRSLTVVETIAKNAALISVVYTIFLSDDRLKHNETTLTNALGTLRQLKPTQYLKSKEIGVDEPAESMTEEAGFIAQDVLQIPELRFAVSHGDYTVTSDDGEVTTVTRPYHLSYNSILTYAVKAIQELDTQLQSALTRIQELEARVQ